MTEFPAVTVVGGLISLQSAVDGTLVGTGVAVGEMSYVRLKLLKVALVLTARAKKLIRSPALAVIVDWFGYTADR